MKKLKKFIYFLFGLLILLVTVPVIVKAAPSNNPVFATIEGVQQMIADALAPILNRLDTVEETLSPIPEQISGLQTNDATMSATIANLQAEVKALGNPLFPTPPSPSFSQPELDFQVNFNEIFSISQGYNIMLIDVPNNIGFPWAPGPVYANGNNSVEQHRYGSNIHSVTIPILSNKYEIRSGAPTNLQVRIRLQADPNSRVIIFGSNAPYPFISKPFNSAGFSLIHITASGGNPQHLTGIVLQREEGGLFVEKARVSCDGGAQCTPATFQLIGGNYRVVIEGSGGGATFAALLRP